MKLPVINKLRGQPIKIALTDCTFRFKCLRMRRKVAPQNTGLIGNLNAGLLCNGQIGAGSKIVNAQNLWDGGD